MVEWAGGLGFEHAGFDGPGAALSRAAGAHFLDHAELDFVDRPESTGMLLLENLKACARFVFQNQERSFLLEWTAL